MHFGKFQADCHVPFAEEWLPSGHATIKAWLGECWRDGCPSGKFSHFHRVTIGFLVTSLTKALLPWLLSLAGRPALGRGGSSILFVVPNFHHFQNDGGHCVLGDLQCCINVLVPFPRSVPRHNPVSELYPQFLLTSWLWFLLWHALSTVGPFYTDRCVPF